MIGCTVTPETMVLQMLLNPRTWTTIHSMVKDIMARKEVDDLTRQRTNRCEVEAQKKKDGSRVCRQYLTLYLQWFQFQRVGCLAKSPTSISLWKTKFHSMLILYVKSTLRSQHKCLLENTYVCSILQFIVEFMFVIYRRTIFKVMNYCFL